MRRCCCKVGNRKDDLIAKTREFGVMIPFVISIERRIEKKIPLPLQLRFVFSYDSDFAVTLLPSLKNQTYVAQQLIYLQSPSR